MRVINAVNRLYTSAYYGISEKARDARDAERDAYFEQLSRAAEEDAGIILDYIRETSQEVHDLSDQLGTTEVCKDTKAARNEIERLRAELKKAANKDGKAYADLDKALVDLKAKTAELDMANEKIASLDERLEKVVERKRTLERMLEEASRDKRAHEAEVRVTRAEKDEALIKIGSMTMELQSLRDELALLRPKSPVGRTRRKLDV